MNFKRRFHLVYICIALLSISSAVVHAQSLVEYQQSMERFSSQIRGLKKHHPKDVIRKTTMDTLDIPYISDVKDSLYKVEFLELSFKTQQQLDTLCSYLPLFPNLKGISFDEFHLFPNKSGSQTTLSLPASFYNLSNLVAIQFKGKSKINIEKEITKISGFPNLRYLMFLASNPSNFPRNIEDLVNLRGISFDYDKSLKGIKLPKALEEIEITSYSKEANIKHALQTISAPTKVIHLGLSYFRIGDSFNSTLQFPSLRDLHLQANKIQDLGNFLANFKHSTGLQRLVVKNGTIVSISDDIYQFRNLQELIITYNRDSLLIPEGISELARLTHLDVSRNNIATLPESLYQLRNLQWLDLSDNKLTRLSDDIEQLTSLTHLKVGRNQLSVLPKNINSLGGLILLDTKGNPLTQLPSLKNLTRLDTLEASYCDLESLPTDIGAMKNLHYLNVENNYIKELPSSVTQLTKLKRLRVAQNLLSSLNDDIGSMEQLEELDISVNYVKKLPTSIGQLKKLKSLSISHNLLTTVPEELALLSNLTYFYAQNDTHLNYAVFNLYREINRNDSSKIDRNISTSKLNSFPKNLSSWHSMESINLSDNDFSSFDIMKSILTIPASQFAVELRNAHVKTLPTSGWRNFLGSELDLYNNEISELPSEMVEAPFLLALNLRKNHLPKFPKNHNTHAGRRSEVLLYFEQVGLIPEDNLPKDEEMATALIEKSYQYFLYDKDYKSCLELYQKALHIDSAIALERADARSIGEANYHMHNFDKAVTHLTQAIQQDTVGLRILNFIIPDFEYRAKSYLALKDTSSALQDYIELASRFDKAYWAQVGILSEQIGQMDNAQQAYKKAIEHCKTEIEQSNNSKNTKELSMLCLMELYIVSNQHEVAAQYANKIENDLTEAELLPIFGYLKAINDMAFGKQNDFSAAEFKGKVSKRWGYDLVLDWLPTAKLHDNQVSAIRDVTSTMIANKIR